MVIFFLPVALYAQDSSPIESREMKSNDVLRKKLWEEFHKVRFEKFNKFQEIDLYEENDSLTRICFICDKGLFIYYHRDPSNNGKSHIEPVIQAKEIKYDSINRITYAKNEKLNFGFFKLWYYETEESSIGAD